MILTKIESFCTDVYKEQTLAYVYCTYVCIYVCVYMSMHMCMYVYEYVYAWCGILSPSSSWRVISVSEDLSCFGKCNVIIEYLLFFQHISCAMCQWCHLHFSHLLLGSLFLLGSILSFHLSISPQCTRKSATTDHQIWISQLYSNYSSINNTISSATNLSPSLQSCLNCSIFLLVQFSNQHNLKHIAP